MVLVCTFTSLYEEKVNNLDEKSPEINKQIQGVVRTTERQEQNNEFPTLYVLNGYSGSAKSWIELKPNLPEIVDEKGMIIVCPDGKNSWYWDSPLNADYQYETFISNELVGFIDNNYPTIKDKSGRAITGLSMGGHGALYNAMRHKDVFSTAGSMSGGVDIRPFPEKWEMSKQLGSRDVNMELWNSHTVINQLDSIQSGDLAMIIDCGEDDFFLEVNKSLHEKLLERKIDHDFITRPGSHNVPYWNNSLYYHILFLD